MQLQLAGNMLNFQLFLIIGTTAATTKLVWATATSINLKLLPATTTLSNNRFEDEVFVQFLKNLCREQHFTTIFILTKWAKNKQTDYCVNLKYYMEYEQHQQQPQQQQQQQNWQSDTLIPVILLLPQIEDYILNDKFNSEFLTIICIPPISSIPFQSSYQVKVIHNQLSALIRNMTNLLQIRVIFRMDLSSHQKQQNSKNVLEILKFVMRKIS